MTTIVLGDDHQVVRQGLQSLLASEPDYQVVGEADEGWEVVRTVERLKPEILILDLMMPGLNGLEILRQVKKLSPSTGIIIFSMHANESYVVEALRNGALGYVLKSSPIDAMKQALQEVVAGRRYLGSPLSERAIEVYLQSVQAGELDLYDTLTARERQVLQLAVEGQTYAEIAARLSISPRTVESHRTNLKSKLGLRTQTDQIRYAMARGVLPKE